MDLKVALKERMQKDSGHLITMYPKLYKKVIKELIKPFREKKFYMVAAPEMKGMFYGPTIAYKLNLPFCPIFKKGRKIPKKFLYTQKFTDYSKTRKGLEIGKIQINKGDKVLLVDDVFETGESAKAAIKLIEKAGGKVAGISIIYNKLNKKNEEFFKKYNFHYLLKNE